MSFKLLRALWRQRTARAGAALLVLAAAAFAQYKLANVPLPVNLETTEKFSPAIVRLGQEELIIEGPLVNSTEGLLFSHDGGPNEIVDVSFERARLDEQTLQMFESLGLRPPATPAGIDYRAQEAKQPSSGGEPCRTRVELRAAAEMPAELHLFQLGTAGLNRYRHLEMTAKGAELTSYLLTESPGDTDVGPGCQKLLRVGDWNQSLSTIEVAAIVADKTALRFTFKPLTPDSALWGGDGAGLEPIDLGAPKLSPNDPPPFRARAVSIRRLGDPTAVPSPLLSAQSTSDGPPLTIYGLRIGSDQLQLSIAGKGWAKIDGEDVTVDLLDRVQKNPIPSALLAAANAALLAWATRLILKSFSTKPQSKSSQARSRKSQRRRRGNTRKQTRDE